MTMKQKSDEKTCWACKRVIAGDAKFGLCPDCLNKYGTPVAALGAAGLSFGGRLLYKNRGKIAKVAAEVVKNKKA